MFVTDHHSQEQLQVLADAIARKRIRERFQAALLAKPGWTAPLIAQPLGCSLRAVKNRVARSNRAGAEALHDSPRTGRPRRLAPEHDPRLGQRLDAPPRPEDGACVLRGLDVRRLLEQEFGALMSLQATYDLLHRLGYRSLMPRPQHEDSNPEVQASFQEIVGERIDAVAEAHPEEEVRVYFEDEARFGTRGTIARVRAPRGSRPRAVRPDGREWLYVLMAAGVSTGAASALIMPALNAGVLDLSLEHFARAWPAGVHAVWIRDGAGRAIPPAETWSCRAT